MGSGYFLSGYFVSKIANPHCDFRILDIESELNSLTEIETEKPFWYESIAFQTLGPEITIILAYLVQNNSQR